MTDLVERLREGNGADWQTAEEAAAEIERLRRCLAKQPNTYMIAYEDGRHEQLARAACEMQDKLEEREAENERLRAALREAYEVYAGSEGFIPETCAEGYQQQIIKQMVGIINAALEEKP